MKGLRKIFIIIIVACVLIIMIFVIGRFGWKFFGFSSCESAGIEEVSVTEDMVHIKGFYPGTFPQGFLGYHAEEIDNKLYVGFQFSGVFGFFETGDFDISIPVQGVITEVIVKTAQNENSVWNSGVKEPTEIEMIEQVYEGIIERYYTALSERWNGQQLLDAGLNILVKDCYGDNPLDNIGYVITDIDGDGTNELAIGTTRGDEFYGKMIFQLYTLNGNNEPLLLFNSIERDRWYYAGDIRFANIGSNSWNESYVTTLKLEDKEMVDMTYTTDMADYVQMELIPFSLWTTSKNSCEPEDALHGWRLEYLEVYTGTETTKFNVRAGEEIVVTISCLNGQFDITIGQKGKEPIYVANKVCSGEFTVTVPEDGEYEISVSGKK